MKFANSCDGAYSSVDVRFTKSCDNSCSFCIEKNGIDSLGNTDVDAIASSIISSGIKDVLILVGEPFLQIDKLHELVCLLRDKVDKIYITTSLPKSFNVTDPRIISILNLINGLNISVHSIDWKENNKIFQAKSNHNRHEILNQLNIFWADKIRTSINLTKGGIDTKEKLHQTLDGLYEIGCKYVKINELQKAPDLFVSYEKLMGKKMKSPYANGCQTHIEEYNGMKILLKRSCFVVEDSLNASVMDFAKVVFKKYFHRTKNKFRVVYENGMMRTKWEVKNV